LKQLGIGHIAAYSPQARGRSERAFSTLQNRLPKELKLAGISSVETANRWLSETYMAQHNKQFAIAAEQEGSAGVCLLDMAGPMLVDSDQASPLRFGCRLDTACGREGLAHRPEYAPGETAPEAGA
jgi:hypothetical protein